MFFLEEFFNGSDLLKIKYLSDVLDHIPYSLVITDKVGTIVYANDKYLDFYKLFGATREELKYLSAQDLVKYGYLNRSGILEAVKAKKPVSWNLRTVRNAKKEDFYVYSAPVYDENGDVYCVFASSQTKNDLAQFINEIEKKMKNEAELARNYMAAVQYLSTKDKYTNDVIVKSPKMEAVYQQAKLVANTDSNVMIFGESGTGKDVLAKFIHANHLFRNAFAFIPVNCAAIPTELMESEFFGYEKGAFTGATKEGKPGFFEISDKGTLFLNEIGELSLTLQSKLLSAVENGKITRLGSVTSKEVNVRIVSATNRDLNKMVSEKTFREDLFYRLNVIPIYLPPLRERVEEIEPLAKYFLEEYNKKYFLNKSFSPEAIEALKKYHFPGNIRELKNLVERHAIISVANEIHLNDNELMEPARRRNMSPLFLKDINPIDSEPFFVEVHNNGKLKDVVRKFEHDYIKEMIKLCGGNVKKTAEVLGTHKSVLYKKIKDY